MTQVQALALLPGRVVTYQANPTATPVVGTVISNSPRLDAVGNAIPFLNNLLVVQLGSGPTRVSWEPIKLSARNPRIEFMSKYTTLVVDADRVLGFPTAFEFL